MIEISVSSELKSVSSDVLLGCVQCQVKTEKFNELLWQEIERYCNKISEELSIEQVNDLPRIKAARDTFKKMGGDPNRYRVSSEALLRRVLQGKGLYKVNSVVDVNNLVSLNSLWSVGSYNLDNLVPPLIFRIGKEGETYKGIGKSTVTISNLPVFTDTEGVFGSPTSDSERAMITLETTSLLMVVYSFSGEEAVADTLDYAKELLEKYAEATQVETALIK